MWLLHHWLLGGLIVWLGLSLPLGLLIGLFLRTADEPPPPLQAERDPAEGSEIAPHKAARF